MNANELADEWQNKVDMWEGKHYENWCDEAATMLRQQADKIAELEKELKRTKFAWNLAENEIERLTPQTKPLTDEEILEICDLGEWYKDEFAIKFARAILRKAQEK